MIRYFPISQASEIPKQKKLGPGEAFVVPNFELAEALIACGTDSARIAISLIHPADPKYPGYAETSLNEHLVPVSPFQFARSILIVLPTYNERQNLEPLVSMISSYIAADILVVDDNSPDGTGQLADQLSRQEKHVHVLHRPQKEGLGPAYLAGFRWALARGYQSIVEMDSDFSHPPWDLPRLVHRSQTADLVIGSRYIQGGMTDHWDWRRRLVSRLGNAYVSLFLGTNIQDWTGGFRCFGRELLSRINLNAVRAKGYVFQVEMAWRARQLGAEICELPIRFGDRMHGHSKLALPTIIEALQEVPRMRFRPIT